MASTEAPRSVNFYGITSKGWNCQFTVRAVDNETLIADMGDLINRLEAIGVQPKAVGRQPEGNGSQNTAPPPQKELHTDDVHPDASYTFEAERMVGSTQGDKVYWKVQGGKFSKYGVTVWPEVLEASGFDPEQLDPAIEYDMQGYTAYYVLNDKGKPDKVVNLAKE